MVCDGNDKRKEEEEEKRKEEKRKGMKKYGKRLFDSWFLWFLRLFLGEKICRHASLRSA